MNSKLTSIITVTHNRPKSLAACLALTRKVVPDDVNIIVFDDASDRKETIHEIIGQFSNTTYLRSEIRIGPAGGRNRCLTEATTPFCLSLDDDCYLHVIPSLTRWEDNIAKDHDIAVVGFRCFDTIPPGRYSPSFTDERPISSFHGGASLLRRDSVLKCGGYLDWLVFGGEDTELAMRLLRLGYRVWYDPSVLVHHDHSMEGRDEALGSFLYVRNTLVIHALHRGGFYGLLIGFVKALRRGLFATDVPSKTLSGLLAGFALTWQQRHRTQEMFSYSRSYAANKRCD